MLSVTLMAVVLITAGCGGGGGGDSGADLNGWWECSTRGPAPGDPYEYIWLGPAAQSGSDVTYYALDLTFDGTTLTGAYPDDLAPNRQEYHLALMSPDLLEGQIHFLDPVGPTVYRDMRMRRAPVPTGSVTGRGNAGGGPLDWSSSTAYAVVESASGAVSTAYDIDILDVGPASGTGITMQFSLVEWLIYPVEKAIPASGGLQLSLADGSYYAATNGSIVLTDFAENGRIRGTYQVIFGLDGTAEGEFDVLVRGTR